MTPQQIADTFIGMAAKAPNNYTRSEILRRGAATFAGMASDPKLNGNAKVKHYLTKVGLEFAGASSEASRATTSDFTQLLRDTADAWNQLGPDAAFQASAAQDATAAQRGIAQTNDPGMAPQVSIAPASWNIDATLGRSTTVKFAPSPDEITKGILQSQTVAFWQGIKREAQAMTVDVGTVLQPNGVLLEESFPVQPRNSARAFALIQYGSDGNTQNAATIDVGLGRRITVVGNYISVIVGMDPPGQHLGVDDISAPLTLGASIGAFAAPSATPPVRTIYANQVAAGALFPPAFAIPLRSVFLLRPIVSALGAVITVVFSGFGGQTISIVGFTNTAAGAEFDPIPVPSDAFFVSVFSSITADVRIPFQLSL